MTKQKDQPTNSINDRYYTQANFLGLGNITNQADLTPDNPVVNEDDHNQNLENSLSGNDVINGHERREKQWESSQM